MFLAALLGALAIVIELVMLAMPGRSGIIAVVTGCSFLPYPGKALDYQQVDGITSTATLTGRNRLIGDTRGSFCVADQKG